MLSTILLFISCSQSVSHPHRSVASSRSVAIIKFRSRFTPPRYYTCAATGLYFVGADSVVVGRSSTIFRGHRHFVSGLAENRFALPFSCSCSWSSFGSVSCSLIGSVIARCARICFGKFYSRVEDYFTVLFVVVVGYWTSAIVTWRDEEYWNVYCWWIMTTCRYSRIFKVVLEQKAAEVEWWREKESRSFYGSIHWPKRRFIQSRRVLDRQTYTGWPRVTGLDSICQDRVSIFMIILCYLT